MKERFFRTLEILEQIVQKYKGTEKNFNSDIKKLCGIETALIRLELSVDGYYSFDIQRSCVMNLIPKLEQISSMEELRNFLKSSEVTIFNLYRN